MNDNYKWEYMCFINQIHYTKVKDKEINLEYNYNVHQYTSKQLNNLYMVLLNKSKLL